METQFRVGQGVRGDDRRRKSRVQRRDEGRRQVHQHPNGQEAQREEHQDHQGLQRGRQVRANHANHRFRHHMQTSLQKGLNIVECEFA